MFQNNGGKKKKVKQENKQTRQTNNNNCQLLCSNPDWESWVSSNKLLCCLQYCGNYEIKIYHKKTKYTSREDNEIVFQHYLLNYYECYYPYNKKKNASYFRHFLLFNYSKESLILLAPSKRVTETTLYIIRA